MSTVHSVARELQYVLYIRCMCSAKKTSDIMLTSKVEQALIPIVQRLDKLEKANASRRFFPRPEDGAPLLLRLVHDLFSLAL